RQPKYRRVGAARLGARRRAPAKRRDETVPTETRTPHARDGAEARSLAPNLAAPTRGSCRPALGLAGRYERPPLGVVAEDTGQHVEAESIQHARVFLLDQIGEVVDQALHGVDLQHLVGDERRHSRPITLGRLLVELDAGLAPAMRLEDADVRARRRVEGDLLAHRT